MTFTKKIAAAALCAGMVLPASAQAGTIIVGPPGGSGVVSATKTFTFSPPAGSHFITISSKDTGNFSNVNFATNGVTFNGIKFVVLSRGVSELQKLVLNFIAPPGASVLSVKYSAAKNGTFTIGTSFAVPEPATWALMVLGFGAVGFAMRRRRQSDGSFGALSFA